MFFFFTILLIFLSRGGSLLLLTNYRSTLLIMQYRNLISKYYASHSPCLFVIFFFIYFHFFTFFQTPCSSFPCQNGAKCVPNYGENQYYCHCTPGYNGRYCETGERIDYESVLLSLNEQMR